MSIIFAAFVFLEGDLFREVNAFDPKVVFVLVDDFLEQCLNHGACKVISLGKLGRNTQMKWFAYFFLIIFLLTRAFASQPELNGLLIGTLLTDMAASVHDLLHIEAFRSYYAFGDLLVGLLAWQLIHYHLILAHQLVALVPDSRHCVFVRLGH